MARVLVDIGLHMLLEIAMGANILEFFGLQNVNWDVGNQLKNGKPLLPSYTLLPDNLTEHHK